jgi:hypothetical protein
MFGIFCSCDHSNYFAAIQQFGALDFLRPEAIVVVLVHLDHESEQLSPHNEDLAALALKHQSWN